MTATITKLEQLLTFGLEYISKSSASELNQKPRPDKWSKKEILGHLIDSGVNNLQRFTEIQFENKPYKIKKYKQAELVTANDYQHSEIEELVKFWVSLNHRIKNLMNRQTQKTLKYEIELDNEQLSDLRFLMKDYVDHLEYHLKQIMSRS